jgi:hypothetical protein
MEQTMAKTNYNQLKRNKEAARKARQEARLARRHTRNTGDAPPAEGGADAANPATSEPGAKP